MDDFQRVPTIEKPPLSGFSILDKFPKDKMESLLWYDGPLESHWIDKDGNDYICTFMDCDDTRIENNKVWELVFKIEPEDFLDYTSNKINYRELISLSREDYFLIEYDKKGERVWSMTEEEIKDLYNDSYPFGEVYFSEDKYDDYYEDTMKPYLQNKIRNSKINSLKL
jgi:hypothetical protein